MIWIMIMGLRSVSIGVERLHLGRKSDWLLPIVDGDSVEDQVDFVLP